MPANEFEKQVQDKLDDFRLSPSASVWKNVEKEIREKKKRRLIIFFILPTAIALLIVSAYYFLNQDSKNQTSIQARSQQQDVSNKEKEETAGNKKIKEQQQQKENNTQSVIAEKNNPTKTGQASNPDLTVPVAPGKDNIVAPTIKTSINGKKNIAIVKPTTNDIHEKGNRVIAPKVTSDLPAKQPVVTSTTDGESKTGSKTIRTAATDTTKTGSGIPGDQKNTVPVSTDSAAAKDIVKDIVENKNQEKVISKKDPGQSKIKWGIDFSAGLTSSLIPEFPSAKSADASPLTSNPQNVPGGIQYGQYLTTPSPVKAGLSFRIGVTVGRQLSKRSSFSSGLQYVYVSSRIKTGSVDTTLSLRQPNSNYTFSQVDRIYRGTPRNEHTNRYHFISVPLTYHWLVSKGKRLKLQWNAGISLNYLVTSNALIYSSSYGGIYYRDKDAFNKMHVVLGSGLSFGFTGKKGMEWMIGPELSFDTRKLVNTNDEYLLFGGVNTKVLFPKRKNK